MTAVTWEWLAGFIDAEGSVVSEIKKHSRSNDYVGCRVDLYQCERSILERVSLLTGGSVSSVKRTAKGREKTSPNARQGYYCGLYGPTLEANSDVIASQLIHKRTQALILHDLTHSGTTPTNHSRAYCMLSRSLNAKGPNREGFISRVEKLYRVTAHQVESDLTHKWGIPRAKFTWDYVAGLFDGDGCFTMWINEGTIRARATVAISSVSFIRSLNIFCSQLHESNEAVYKRSRHNPRVRPQGFCRFINQDSLAYVCDMLIPHLQIKRRQALLVWYFTKMRAERVGSHSRYLTGRTPYPTRRKDYTPLDYAICQFVQALNTNGRNMATAGEQIALIEKTSGIRLTEVIERAEDYYAAQKSDSFLTGLQDLAETLGLA